MFTIANRDRLRNVSEAADGGMDGEGTEEKDMRVTDHKS